MNNVKMFETFSANEKIQIEVFSRMVIIRNYNKDKNGNYILINQSRVSKDIFKLMNDFIIEGNEND